jgi:hypothetical protein
LIYIAIFNERRQKIMIFIIIFRQIPLFAMITGIVPIVMRPGTKQIGENHASCKINSSLSN